MQIYTFEKKKLDQLPGFEIYNRDAVLESSVKTILEDIRDNGVKACIACTQKFDNITINENDICIDPKKTDLSAIPADFDKALRKAIANITRFHKHQKPRNFRIKISKESFAGEKWYPLDRVGCYVPGGTAPLISTVLMTVIPAKIAGVKSIVVATPPAKNGAIHPFILYACKLLGVETVLKLGGIQGVAAMALGTGLPPVQKIVGPGNRFVTEAKRQLYGIVDIDMLAGPSEVCILADASANPDYIASDLLSQIEHDNYAKGILISLNEEMIGKVIDSIHTLIEKLGRREILKQSLKNLLFIYESDKAKVLKLSDSFAPEHLEVMISSKEFEKHPYKAGAVFFGNYTPVAVGDFFGGTNHVLPTSRRASFSSPLSVYDFFRRSHFIKYDQPTIKKNGKYIETLAGYEELPAHKNSVTVRTTQS